MIIKKCLTPRDCELLVVCPSSRIHTPITYIQLSHIKLLHHPYIDHPRCTRPHSVATHTRGLVGGYWLGGMSRRASAGDGIGLTPRCWFAKVGGTGKGGQAHPSQPHCLPRGGKQWGWLGVLRRPCSSQTTMGGHVALQGVPCSASMGGPPWLAAPFSIPFPLAKPTRAGPHPRRKPDV